MRKKTIILFCFSLLLIVLVSCSSSKKDDSKKEKIPVQSASVLGKFLKVERSGDSLTFIFKVEEIIGYGASTKPIAPNSTIQVSISEGNKLTFNDINDAISSMSSFELLVKMPSQGMNTDSAHNWKLIAAKKK